MKKLFCVAMMALYSFQLQADNFSRQDATKKELLETSQEELLEKSPTNKIESDICIQEFTKKIDSKKINLSVTSVAHQLKESKEINEDEFNNDITFNKKLNSALSQPRRILATSACTMPWSDDDDNYDTNREDETRHDEDRRAEEQRNEDDARSAADAQLDYERQTDDARSRQQDEDSQADAISSYDKSRLADDEYYARRDAEEAEAVAAQKIRDDEDDARRADDEYRSKQNENVKNDNDSYDLYEERHKIVLADEPKENVIGMHHITKCYETRISYKASKRHYFSIEEIKPGAIVSVAALEKDIAIKRKLCTKLEEIKGLKDAITEIEKEIAEKEALAIAIQNLEKKLEAQKEAQRVVCAVKILQEAQAQTKIENELAEVKAAENERQIIVIKAEHVAKINACAQAKADIAMCAVDDEDRFQFINIFMDMDCNEDEKSNKEEEWKKYLMLDEATDHFNAKFKSNSHAKHIVYQSYGGTIGDNDEHACVRIDNFEDNGIQYTCHLFLDIYGNIIKGLAQPLNIERTF